MTARAHVQGALAAIRDGHTRLAFDELYAAELALHCGGPPDPADSRDLMAAWSAFREHLPPREEGFGGDRTFVPPPEVAENARRALSIRATMPKSRRGMTPVGLARARDLQNQRPLSVKTVRRMKAYFDRHAQDKTGRTWDDYGKGRQAWDGWGGDEGYAWVKSVLSGFGAESPSYSASALGFGAVDLGFGAVDPVESLHPDFRDKAEALVFALSQRTDSRGKPWQPKVYYGWRSPEVQADLYKRGKSDVKFSYHNVVDPEGGAKALAADIIDRRYAWELYDKETAFTIAQRNAFWLALGEEAEKLGLTWGGRWKSLYDPAHVQAYSTSDNALALLARGEWPPPGLERPLPRGLIAVNDRGILV